MTTPFQIAQEIAKTDGFLSFDDWCSSLKQKYNRLPMWYFNAALQMSAYIDYIKARKKGQNSHKTKGDKTMTTNTPKTTKTPAPKKATKKASSVKGTTAAAPKKAAPTKATTSKMTVADIARELNINPKVARAKLRRAGMGSKDGRWVSMTKTSKEYKEVVAKLKK